MEEVPNLTKVEKFPNLTKVEEVPCLSCFLELFLETFLSRFNLQAHTDAAAGEQGAASGLGGTSECPGVDYEQISTARYKVGKSPQNDQILILEIMLYSLGLSTPLTQTSQTSIS